MPAEHAQSAARQAGLVTRTAHTAFLGTWISATALLVSMILLTWMCYLRGSKTQQPSRMMAFRGTHADNDSIKRACPKGNTCYMDSSIGSAGSQCECCGLGGLGGAWTEASSRGRMLFLSFSDIVVPGGARTTQGAGIGVWEPLPDPFRGEVRTLVLDSRFDGEQSLLGRIITFDPATLKASERQVAFAPVRPRFKNRSTAYVLVGRFATSIPEATPRRPWTQLSGSSLRYGLRQISMRRLCLISSSSSLQATS